MNYSSRLARRYDRLSKQQSYLLLIGAAVLLVIFIFFGFPTILNLTAYISSLGRKGSTIVDKSLAPTTPRLAQEFEATNSSQIKLSGVADPNVTVELFQNNQSESTTITDDDGTFGFEVTLSKGDNVFTVQATSNSGVKSNRSENYVITYLAAVPRLEVTSPKDGDIVKDSQLAVSGKTDVGATVTVNDHLVITGSDGSFSGTVTLSSGDNKIKVVATDRAGNQTIKELIVKYSP